MAFRTDGATSKAVRLVEAVMKGLGVVPDENRISASGGGATWQLSRGSADIMIAINPGPEGASPRLRIVAPLVKLGRPLEAALAIKLLELNATELPGIAFALFRGDVVGLVTERGVAELDRAEVEELLAAVGHFADRYDDVLVTEFGGTRVCDLG